MTLVLTPTKMKVLEALLIEDGRTTAELAADTGVPVAKLKLPLNMLVKNGLVSMTLAGRKFFVTDVGAAEFKANVAKFLN